MLWDQGEIFRCSHAWVSYANYCHTLGLQSVTALTAHDWRERDLQTGGGASSGGQEEVSRKGLWIQKACVP